MRSNFSLSLRSIDDSVGAIINRPAVPCYEFAGTNANTGHFSARADNIRPYDIHITQHDKHQFDNPTGTKKPLTFR